MKLNEKIQYMRKKAGLSQEELAEIVGVSRQAVSKWETGEATPEVSKLLLLSRAFGVTADWLISDEGVEAETGRREGQDREAQPDAPGWVDALPNALGRLIKRYGWLFGVWIAVSGGALMIFAGIVTVMSGSFFRGFGGAELYSPFAAFRNIVVTLGVILIIAGVVLAVVLKKYGDKK